MVVNEVVCDGPGVREAQLHPATVGIDDIRVNGNSTIRLDTGLAIRINAIGRQLPSASHRNADPIAPDNVPTGRRPETRANPHVISNCRIAFHANRLLPNNPRSFVVQSPVAPLQRQVRISNDGRRSRRIRNDDAVPAIARRHVRFDGRGADLLQPNAVDGVTFGAVLVEACQRATDPKAACSVPMRLASAHDIHPGVRKQAEAAVIADVNVLDRHSSTCRIEPDSLVAVAGGYDAAQRKIGASIGGKNTEWCVARVDVLDRDEVGIVESY